MSRDSTGKVLTVAFLLCVVCSVLVSAAAVVLSDRQERNKLEEKEKEHPSGCWHLRNRHPS